MHTFSRRWKTNKWNLRSRQWISNLNFFGFETYWLIIHRFFCCHSLWWFRSMLRIPNCDHFNCFDEKVLFSPRIRTCFCARWYFVRSNSLLLNDQNPVVIAASSNLPVQTHFKRYNLYTTHGIVKDGSLITASQLNDIDQIMKKRKQIDNLTWCFFSFLCVFVHRSLER